MPLTCLLLTTLFFVLFLYHQSSIKKIVAMTKHYFENKTGKRVTESEFEDIENVYLNLPIMDRDKFCENWQKVGFNPIVMELSDYVSTLIRKIADLNLQIKN